MPSPHLAAHVLVHLGALVPQVAADEQPTFVQVRDGLRLCAAARTHAAAKASLPSAQNRKHRPAPKSHTHAATVRRPPPRPLPCPPPQKGRWQATEELVYARTQLAPHPTCDPKGLRPKRSVLQALDVVLGHDVWRLRTQIQSSHTRLCPHALASLGFYEKHNNVRNTTTEDGVRGQT